MKDLAVVTPTAVSSATVLLPKVTPSPMSNSVFKSANSTSEKNISSSDLGLILQPYRLDQIEITNNIVNNDPDFDLDNLSDFIVFDDSKNVYRPHFSGGLGLKLMMNDNFVLSVDWAAPFDKRDNSSLANFYVKIGYMF